MLSYRHGFHAGNFADVLKHSVLISVLEYMTRKEKALCYVDTHSGAGMYSLHHEFSQKTGEYEDGIGKLYSLENAPQLIADYVEAIKSLNTENEKNDLAVYPGSPGIAKAMLRKQDNLHLFELHPSDAEPLVELFSRWRKAFVHQEDSYKGALGHLPPPSRRGVMLVDPPYELKNDYGKAVTLLTKAYKRFATGTYILWYPVVTRSFIDSMKASFEKSDVKNLLQVEFCMKGDTEAHGMTGSGLFIINPPWTLKAQLEEALPYLIEHMGTSESSYTLEQVIPE